MNKVFELGKDFRNEGIDRTHNPEFTVCEIYEAYGDRTSMEAIMEGLLPHLCDTVIGTRQVAYGDKGDVIDFNPPYRRVAYKDLVKGLMGDDWFELDFATQLAKAKAKGAETDTNLELDGVTTELMLTHEVYDKLIERNLMQPTFVTRIPHEFVPLAKACKDDPLPRLHRAERPARAAQGAREPGGRGHGEDRRGLHFGSGVRHAADGRARLRRRPARHVPHGHGFDPRRRSLPADEKGVEQWKNPSRKSISNC